MTRCTLAATDVPGPTDGPLQLDEQERELLESELRAVVPALSGQRRERYEALADAVSAGSVPTELQPHLESVVSLALQTARARQMYRAEGEGVLTRLYRRTPGGRELSDHLNAVNGALTALNDHTLRSVTVGMRTLGHFTVRIDTDQAQIVLGVRPDSVNVESVAVS